MTVDTIPPKKPRFRVPAIAEQPAAPADAPLDVANAPLPMPEGAGAPPAGSVKDLTPYRIFVSYVVGKDKFNSNILHTPFEDVDTEGAVSAIQIALERIHEGKRITLLFFRAIER